MDQAQFIGYIVLAMITIGSFAVLIVKLTAPINELKLVIQRLSDCVDTMIKNNEVQNKRLEKHGIEIDDLKLRVGKIEFKVESWGKVGN